jgi:hypothetical protein
MLEFCPHCGEIGGLQRRGQSLICCRCGKEAGTVPTAPDRVVVDQAAELIRQGTASHCPVCRQLVEVRGQKLARHFESGGLRKLCAGSGQILPTATVPAASAATPESGKDLSAFMTRESIRVVSCRRNAPPHIEELTLAYLDKNDRVRVQIDALRDILGPSFQMRDYPPSLGRPPLVLWCAAAMCVIGKRHERGGYQDMTDQELYQVIADLQLHAALFFS